MFVHGATKELKRVANSRSGNTLESREKQRSRRGKRMLKEGRICLIK